LDIALYIVSKQKREFEMKIQTLSTRQVAELTETTWCPWVDDCVSQIEGGDDNIVGACGIYGILSMASAMAGSYDELYEIEHDGLRRCALVKL
jgi:hypothetical protein